ncbi:hypothetical protein CHS0354_021923 [Potamilus streckersoni]|uniref:Uncharacterized protein n=1 Tax=Potamilus streckersoni TaxID=2493646 RepID=A0AAE0VX49_9BIVA|nr:hypothetical protein CHS0354_021923 [Potamilus streckersoni]
MDIPPILPLVRLVCSNSILNYKYRGHNHISILDSMFYLLVDFIDTEDIDPQLVHPWADRICCYLPATCQRVHRFPKQNDIELSEMEHKNKQSYAAPYDVNDDLETQAARHRVTYRNGDVQLPIESDLPDGGATKL